MPQIGSRSVMNRPAGVVFFGAMARILLLTPPFTQLNTPYPATAYLKGYLNGLGVEAAQADLGIEVVDAMLCASGVRAMFDEASPHPLLDERILYERAIDPVMRFLRGEDPTLARQLAQPGFLPVALDEVAEGDLEWAFGTMGIHDRAKHLSTRFLEQLSRFVVEAVDADFGFTRYAEQLGRCAYTFDALAERLAEAPSYVDRVMLPLLKRLMEEHRPEWVGLSIPFPGNLLGGLRIGQWLKAHHPEVRVVLGGGFANTELRSVRDPRLFDFVDFVTLDDGETPLRQLLDGGPYRRTFRRVGGEVQFEDTPSLPDVKLAEAGTPDYTGLRLGLYLDAIEQTNPMHTLWSDGRWNKMTLAHGCYWARCTFCDVSLDYIAVYEPVAARQLVDRIEELVAATGQTGFHFVDEAAPPSLLRALALELLKRGVVITWWTNIRFEERFTADLCRLLRASGCVAVAGGLEVASDRLLALIEKGVTVDQVARVARHFTDAGVLVHAYLMYGFPTQTAQETVNSLERVRQLFAAGVIHSGFWHRFALTAHSPVGKDPERFGIEVDWPEAPFALNDLPFTDPTGTDHEAFSDGLRISLYNWMRGEGLDLPLRRWFEFPTPKPKVPKHWAQRIVESAPPPPSPHGRVAYLGAPPVLRSGVLIAHGVGAAVDWPMNEGEAALWSERLNGLQPGGAAMKWLDATESGWAHSEFAMNLRTSGLLLVV